jgi:hypothetical protein
MFTRSTGDEMGITPRLYGFVIGSASTLGDQKTLENASERFCMDISFRLKRVWTGIRKYGQGSIQGCPEDY